MQKIRSKVALLILGMTVVLATACSQSEDKQELEVEVTPVLYDRDCIVTIVSDDGKYESGKKLHMLARNYDMRVTVAGVVGILDGHKEEWQEMEKEGSVEVICHSYTHAKMSEEADLGRRVLRHEIKDSIKYCRDNFTSSQIAFIPPENTMCEEGYELLRKAGIYAIRQGGRGLNSLSPEEGTDAGQWYNLLTNGIGDVETTDERNQWVDDAIGDRAWLIEMWHNITESGEEGGYQEIAVAAADEHMAYIAEMSKQQKVWVASMTEATKYIYERENAKISAVYDGKTISVKLKCDMKGKNKSEFDLPLTVKVKLPEELNKINIFEVNHKQIEAKEENRNKYIYFEMTPDDSCEVIW